MKKIILPFELLVATIENAQQTDYPVPSDNRVTDRDSPFDF